MTKVCVKKPFYVLVAVIIVLTIGFVSITRMQTDLMPDMEMPYLAVIVTEPGASPEQVKMDVTEPVESALGTVNGVENITSTSSANYATVMLEFGDDTDMDAALVRVSMALDSLELPEECGQPNILEVSMDMIATMYASVDYEGRDIKEVTTFVDQVVRPYLERQEGVANIVASGMVEDTVEIRLNQEKIDKINQKILTQTNEKLADAQKEIDDAKASLEDGKAELKKQKKNLEKQQNDTNQELASTNVQLAQAQASKAAYESSLNSLQAGKSALEAEKKAYKDAKMEETYESMDAMFAAYQSSLGEAAANSQITIPGSVQEAVANKENLQAFLDWMDSLGYGDQIKDVNYDTLKQLSDVVTVRLPQIDTELANLDTEIAAAQAVVDQMSDQMKDMDEQQTQAVAGGYSAAAGFGSTQAQIASGEEQLKSAEADLEDAQAKVDEAKEAALKNANLDALLSLETLSSIIYSQDFSMPAGYINDKDDNQWLVEVGDHFSDTEELGDLVLTKIDDIGKIKLRSVADITTIDNAGETYAKMNGNEAVLLAIYKSSTASTSDVSGSIAEAFDELESQYEGLTLTPIMNQGDYITMILHSVLSSILLGALLAIIVLALFLKDVKPTIVVAFSIPFSVFFAIIIMYFTKITLNVMSLAGLTLGIGMLVDNSIVVMENIYRLIGKGMSEPKAAVQGTKQVAAPIIASTATTICVFLPMVYTSGMISQMLIPFAFTISYALIASLIVAMTVVPTMSSVLMRSSKVRRRPLFEKLQNGYGKVLGWCLRFKIVPLAIAIVLFVLSVAKCFETGLNMLDDMESNQISATLTMDDEDDKETCYATADEVMNRILSVDGIAKVGALDGNTSAVSVAGAGGTDNYRSFTFSILTDDEIKTTGQFQKIISDIEKKTKDVDCKEFEVTSSALGSMGSMFGSGLEVDIYGSEQDELIKISEDVMAMMADIEGTENIKNGVSEDSKTVHLEIDRNKAAACGLTTAQIFQEIAKQTSTEKTAISMTTEGTSVDVNVVDETDPLTYENLLDLEITVDQTDVDGESKSKTYKLSKFATMSDGYSLDSILRENQSNYMAVTAEVQDGYNATLLARDLQEQLDAYELPDNYTMDMGGESSQVMDMVNQMLQAIALGLLLIYLVMVAQFQSLLSPFIILFTIPLAFTGGMLGLLIFDRSISAIALMGFMILMGTVVNNGIVFVDYTNQLRMQGVEKHMALIATGKTRMRPILMTALTTILSMSVMVFSQDAGNAMQKSMAIVVACGLVYSTLMTLFIVPVMYDILYRKQPKVIDVGDERDLDGIPDEAEEIIAQMNLS